MHRVEQQHIEVSLYMQAAIATKSTKYLPSPDAPEVPEPEPEAKPTAAAKLPPKAAAAGPKRSMAPPAGTLTSL